MKYDPNQEEYKITDFYDTETYILLCKNDVLINNNISIQNLFPDFFKNSFVPVLNSNDFTVIAKINTENNSPGSPFTKMKLRPVSPDLENQQYIHELFKDVLKTELPPLMRFHLLYQVIELLINDIGIRDYRTQFNTSVKTALEKLLNADLPSAYHDAKENIDDLKKEINVVKSEKERLNTLITKIPKSKLSDYPKLSEAIDAVKQTGITDDTKLGEKVYFIRNLLVHGYHLLKTDAPDIDMRIRTVNEEFEKFIVETVIGYRPNP